MYIKNIGHNHCHDSDFVIDCPNDNGYHLLLLLKTEGIFLLDGQETILPANTLIVFRQGACLSYRCLPGQAYANDWIQFLFEEDEEEIFLALGLEYGKPLYLQNASLITLLIKLMVNEFHSDHKHMQGNLNHYGALLFSHASEQIGAEDETQKTTQFDLIAAVRNRILYDSNHHFYSVVSCAHEVRMSKSNFQHLYKKFFGVSVMHDVIQARVERAKLLLRSTEFTSLVISQRCGFGNYSHFARQFKAHTGMTPLEYRRAHSDDGDV